MGAKKLELFNAIERRDSELGFVVSAPARIEILKYLLEQQVINGPILLNVIPLNIKTINQHIKVLERAGLITGFYVGKSYYWKLNEQCLDDLGKISWIFEN
jgi:DNA-binding transcriptional ArsR family regulator|uniref:ArsR/SmtB family transcription factor n=1 Tax=Fluviicola sp. TaxID=1917219 RepID=UPI00404B0D1D